MAKPKPATTELMEFGTLQFQETDDGRTRIACAIHINRTAADAADARRDLAWALRNLAEDLDPS